MNNKYDVVITYGWNRVSYNVLRNLSINGLKVIVGDESKYNMCSMSKYSQSSFQYPSPFVYPEKFIDKLLEIIEKYKPKVLMPCHEESFVIAKYRDRFPKDLIIPIAEYDVLMKAHDKISANEIAMLADIPIPKIYDVHTMQDLEQQKESFQYPVVIKLSNSNASKGVFYANSYKELKEIFQNNLNELNKLYIQEYAQGSGYGASFIYKGGKMISGFVHKRLIEKTHTGGVSTKRISVKNDKILNYGKSILDYLKWTGPAMVEFKYDEEKDQAWFIEINARYWGSLPLPIASGLDMPYWHYLSALDKDIKTNDYKTGVVSIWVLGAFITLAERLLSKKLTFVETKSILNFKADNYDDLKKDDLKAFLGEIVFYLSKFIKTGSTNPKVEGMGNF
jgi:predicted ATP-grasp superfamily ATP-dependent carboligase